MIVVFAGPTIRQQQILEVLEDVVIMPPASAGDVYHAAQSLPGAIGIIDGYFDSVPSVWHKEILWALDMGVPVFGASSMGALRAAELHTFGMTGIGQIFEDYRDGVLEDDDEVALQHGPDELGYAPLSEPMVNIRATLRRAVHEEIIEEALAEELILLAKNRFYPDRSWDNLFSNALDHGITDDVVQKLMNWLPEGRVDQKQADAVTMLAEIKNHLSDKQAEPDFSFDFQHTVMWDRLRNRVDSRSEPTLASVMLDCLRTDPDRYQEFRDLAVIRMFENLDAAALDVEISREALDRAMTGFRTHKKLFTAAALNDWLAENGLDQDGLQRLIAEEISANEQIRSHPDAFRKAMLAELKAAGYESELSTRARAIIDVVEQKELRNADPEELGLSNLELHLWYFETCLEVPLPDNLNQYLEKFDFADRHEFERMMMYQFIHWSDSQAC